MHGVHIKHTVALLALSGWVGIATAQQNLPAANPAPAAPAQAARPAAGGRQANAAPPPPMKLTSNGIADGVQIAARYTCSDPQAISPGLKWTDAPRGTESFALIVHDMEPRPRKGNDDILHWMVWDMPATASQLPEGVLSNTVDLPDGSRQSNGNPGQGGILGYRPPCPPQNVPVPHHYAFEVFALDQRLNLASGATRADVMRAMDGHILGHASLVAVLSR
jgi:Raf kinase inhibitor-like YbhB/YbcL family protein